MDPIKTFLHLRMVARAMERKLKGLAKYSVLVFFVAVAAVVVVVVDVVDSFVDHYNIQPFRCYLSGEAFGFLQFPIFYFQRNVAVDKAKRA